MSGRRVADVRGTASLLPMADQSTQSITVDAPAADVMAVIADFPAYPQWVAAAKKVEVEETGDDGRASRVHFVLDAGAVKGPPKAERALMSAQRPLTAQGPRWQPVQQATGRSASGCRVPGRGAAGEAGPCPGPPWWA